MFFKQTRIPKTVAAVDLGSNSFHLVIAEYNGDDIRIVDHLRESVGLSRDLKATGKISDDAWFRALACLEKFSQRIKEIPQGWVNAVGTNTFRKAANAAEFLTLAQATLGHPIDVISGPEEARLIYLGVCHGLSNDTQARLVFDIGGSSSELILGIGPTPKILESFDVGCVTLSTQYFGDGTINLKKLKQAEITARAEFGYWTEIFKRETWQIAFGTSGTIRTIDQILATLGLSKEGISSGALDTLAQRLSQLGSTDAVAKEFNLDKTRAGNLPGGFAILRALFRALNISAMVVSDKALRQGLIYDKIGISFHDDIRSRSIGQLAEKFHVDAGHAQRVRTSALKLYEQVSADWGLDYHDARYYLDWALQVHEIGLSISHTQYHKHGAYILENCDVLGFSRQEQKIMALLVRAHRKKLPQSLFEGFSTETVEALLKILTLMRLAVVLNRNRSDQTTPEVNVRKEGEGLALQFPANWLADHPLSAADLEYEAGILKARGIVLSYMPAAEG